MRRCPGLFRLNSDKLLCFYYRSAKFWSPPAKSELGEDAYLSIRCAQAVLDGVGWWNMHASVDAGTYSRALARAMFSYVGEDLNADSPSSSLTLLQHAYDSCKAQQIQGTSTALVVTLQPPRDDELSFLLGGADYQNCILDICSLGDCTAMVIRRGRIVFVSEEQSHEFDHPYQLGEGSSDTPSRALSYRFPVQRGDLVLLGSDGVFDNLYPQRVAELMWPVVDSVQVKHSAGPPSTPQTSGRVDFWEDMMLALAAGAEGVMREAASAAGDVRSDTPYARKAVRGGVRFEGGKQDDMTLLVSVLDEAAEIDFGDRIPRGAAMNPHPYRDWP